MHLLCVVFIVGTSDVTVNVDPGARDSHIKVTGMLVVFLRDRNCIF